MNEIIYNEIADYLHLVSKQFDINICINDFAGFLPMVWNSGVFQPFYIHSNEYCMYIKTNKDLFNKCLNCKKDIIRKCNREKNVYFGRCHAGVLEYIIPVFYHEKVIAAISAGVYKIDPKKYNRISDRIYRNYGLDYNILNEKYNNSMSEIVPELGLVKSLFSVIARYFQYIYENYLQEDKVIKSNIKYNSNADFILNHALEYIKRNYIEKIKVSEIAVFCHCSESYINHIFKSRIGYNINNYVNHLRIEEAKKYLQETNMSIKEIASNTGFNDSNYFSKVFNDICLMYPKEYRKKYYK